MLIRTIFSYINFLLFRKGKAHCALIRMNTVIPMTLSFRVSVMETSLYESYPRIMPNIMLKMGQIRGWYKIDNF